MSTIELIARGLATDRDRLLLCRNVRSGYHYLPGGHVEFGEPAAAALAREFLEEAGITVRVGPLLCIAEITFQQPTTTGARTRHEINFVFHVAADPWPDPVRTLEPDIAFDWAAIDQLRALDVRPPALLDWLLTNPTLLPQGAPLLTAPAWISAHG